MAAKRDSEQSFDLGGLALDSFAEMVEAAPTPKGSQTDVLYNEIDALCDILDKLRGLDGAPYSKAKAKGREAAAKAIVLITQIWACAADESLVEMFAAFVVPKQSTDQ